MAGLDRETGRHREEVEDDDQVGERGVPSVGGNTKSQIESHQNYYYY